VSRSANWTDEGAERAGSLDAARALSTTLEVWVMGGGRLYAEAIGHADVLEVTQLDLEVEGDTFAPPLAGWTRTAADPDDGWRVSRTGIRYRFETYEPGDR
jgi:dihydrofolate reductase